MNPLSTSGSVSIRGGSPSSSSSSFSTMDSLEAGTNPLKDMAGNRPDDSELRVLIFTACYFVLDGVTLTIRRLESYLKSRGAVVRVVSTVPTDWKEDTNDMIIVPGIGIPFSHSGSAYAFGAGLSEENIKEIEAYRPNILHFTVPDIVSMDGVNWCQKNNIAYMATWHSNYCEYLKYYYMETLLRPFLFWHLRGFYEQMPYLYVPTPYIKDKMQKEGFGICTTLKEWGRGVDLNLFSPDRRSEAFRSARGIEPHDIVILWVGRLVPEKHPDIWMSCVKRLQDEGIHVKAMIVGQGTYESELTELKDVISCGWLSGEALAEAYASADILLFPSDVETFGNVTLEALASGLCGVVEEMCSGHLVDHGYNGFTCKSGDFDGFYEATKKIVLDNALRKQMSEHARQSAWKFERAKILQMMAENYKDCIVECRDDPFFLNEFIKKNPYTDGRKLMEKLCCNFWLVRTFGESFLTTTSSFQNFAVNSAEFASSKIRLSCSDLRGSLEDDWHDHKMDKLESKKNTKGTGLILFCYTIWNKIWLMIPMPFLLSTNCIKTINYVALMMSYMLIALLTWISFTTE